MADYAMESLSLGPSVVRVPRSSTKVKYLNKCVDGTTSAWVYWITHYIDSTGEDYPGTTFDSGTYKVQAMAYERVD